MRLHSQRQKPQLILSAVSDMCDDVCFHMFKKCGSIKSKSDNFKIRDMNTNRDEWS